MALIKHKCSICGRERRRLLIYKGVQICYPCYAGVMTKCESLANNKSWDGLTLQQALDKTYEVKGYLSQCKRNKKYYIKSVANFPQILIGHKFKVVLVD